MSEKMNRMLSSIWGRYVDDKNPKKLVKYKTWCNQVDKKCAATISSLKALECADAEKKEKLTNVTSKVITAVNELISVLSVSGYKYNTAFREAAPHVQDLVRDALLDVWPPLLHSIQRLELIDGSAVTGVHKAVLMVMVRDEFSCESFQAVQLQQSREPSHAKDILGRYRRMLQTTLHTATHRLGEKPPASTNLTATFSVAVNSMMNIQFACKVLAVLYWRLPHVGSAISQILEIPDIELIAPVLSFPAFSDDTITISHSSSQITNNNNNNNNSTVPPNSDNTNIQPTPRTKRGSSLYGWPQLYKDLPPLTDTIVFPPLLSSSSASVANSSLNGSSSLNSSSSSLNASTSTISSAPLESSPSLPSPTPWLTVMMKFDVTYITFFKEWILHVKSTLDTVEWNTVPGFPRLLQSLLYQMRTKDQPPPPLSKPYPLLELQYILLEQTNAELIDAFVKSAFLRTNVFDLMSVLNTLHLLDGWFSELLSSDFLMPTTFDMPFFCSGISILLQSDHHQTVLRVVSFIYAYSELFSDPQRALLFDLFLNKFFYALFLHWDPGVRNAYHQLLVFKMVRIKRSTLYNDGYVVKELSQVGTTTYHSKDSPPDSNHHSTLSHSRSGSGFFSSFSILPSFFNLSSSPEKETPSERDPTPPTDSIDSNSSGMNGVESQDVTNKTSQQTDPIQAGGKTSQSNANKMNSEWRTAHANGSPTGVSSRDRSESLDESSFVKLDCDPSDPKTPRSSTPTPTDTPSNTIQNPTPTSTPGQNSAPTLDNNPTLNPTPNTTLNPAPNPTPTPTNPAINPTPTPDGNIITHYVPTTTHHVSSASIDVQLFLKLNSYLKTVEDQLRKPTAKKAFEGRLEVYAPSALAEFNQHLARYHQWELKSEDPPRIIPLPFARMGEG